MYRVPLPALLLLVFAIAASPAQDVKDKERLFDKKDDKKDPLPPKREVPNSAPSA
ncbi:MAG: hypothetical protein HYR84_05675 [Planctomycetes bacterium]|nr:hypothetical protein [Planctomycetota bacterium]